VCTIVATPLAVPAAHSHDLFKPGHALPLTSAYPATPPACPIIDPALAWTCACLHGKLLRAIQGDVKVECLARSNYSSVDKPLSIGLSSRLRHDGTPSCNLGPVLHSLPRWSRSVADASHLSELRMKGGHLYYLSPYDWLELDERRIPEQPQIIHTSCVHKTPAHSGRRS